MITEAVVLEGGPADGRHLTLTAGTATLRVPMWMEGSGFGEYVYAPTDRITPEGLRVWASK
jgi:hypothetical protein